MLNSEKSNKIECCVLAADLSNGTHFYKIPTSSIEESMKIIKVGLNKLNNPCSRVYIAGFNLISENDLLTKEELIKQLSIDSRNIKRIK